MRAYRLVAGAVLAVLLAGGAPAKEPQEVVDEAVQKVLKIIATPEFKDAEPAKKREMHEQIRSVLLDVADMKGISSLCLATFRKKFSDEQFEKFNGLFSRLLFATYVSHFDKYVDQKVVVADTKKTDDAKAVVSTKVISDTGEIPIEYSLSKQGDTWKLYDVRVEGVSLVMNYRSQFREILINSTVDKFLKRLEEKVKKNEENL